MANNIVEVRPGVFTLRTSRDPEEFLCGPDGTPLEMTQQEALDRNALGAAYKAPEPGDFYVPKAQREEAAPAKKGRVRNGNT